MAENIDPQGKEQQEGIAPKGKEGEGSEVLTPDDKKIQDLNKVIGGAISSFEDAGNDLTIQIVVWIVVCLAISLFAFYLYFGYFFNLKMPHYWSWQVIFFSVIRLTFITAYFYVGLYCFKMLSSTFQLYQHNRHKVSVLKSLPSLMVASQHQDKASNTSVNQDTLYNKILDIVITFSNTGIIGNEHELKPTSDLLYKILDVLVKLLKRG